MADKSKTIDFSRHQEKKRHKKAEEKLDTMRQRFKNASKEIFGAEKPASKKRSKRKKKKK